jgi:phenylpropionate dioxygenase-like ring-hydroxylating dioxygenase large terminal subunit
MFVNQHQLQYLLRPDRYFSEEQYELEIKRLFLPAWHFVATRSELPRNGDFVALDLFGHPVLIRNFGGEYFAFQNVCAHRHCTLTRDSSGNSPVLRCQYHGWEYDQTGRTARIPDAGCFRPWDRENSQLVTYRVEALGDLLFTALTDDAPPLREWLDPYGDDLAREYSAPEWKMRWAWDYDGACNWKVPLENTLESYHIPAVHAESFGGHYPREEDSQHTLTHQYTELDYVSSTPTERRAGIIRRWLGGTPSGRYIHRHIHPHTILVTMDTLNYALILQPTSSRTVRIRLRLFSYQGTRRDPLSKAIAWLAWQIGKSVTLRILMEDREVYAAQQRGLEASGHRGVIGTREERIFAFQEYILSALGMPSPLADGPELSMVASSATPGTEDQAWRRIPR